MLQMCVVIGLITPLLLELAIYLGWGPLTLRLPT
jgi:hypothetical protein